MNYKAFHIREINKTFQSSIETLTLPDLEDGYVRIQVHYSSLNYKDALSASGNKGVTKKYPHTPGIDAAGLITDSRSNGFVIGQKVIVTGNDLGMNTNGGFGAYIQVPESWVVPLPENMSLQESMIYGTAGFTAALSIYKMAHYVKPADGQILVTGASGGVGSMALRILQKLNYSTLAISNKPEFYKTLEAFGANSILKREDVIDTSDKPMLSGKWQGIIDTVGGDMLTSTLKSLHLNGVVTTCGNLRSQTFTTSVYPFILRGITLIGITSASCDYDTRLHIWNQLANNWKPEKLHDAVTEITLEKLPIYISKILKGQLTGRTIIKHQI